MNSTLHSIFSLFVLVKKNPKQFWSLLKEIPYRSKALDFSRHYCEYAVEPNFLTTSSDNPILRYFESVKEGPGIWKWMHYFEIYHRHLNRFIGKPINLLEIGIYSGGSLKMWQNYLGDLCQIYGVDIQKECKSYENHKVRVFIGDQQDPIFWNFFKNEVPGIDVLIDDGGHSTEQQRVTLEEMLPFLNLGGVYICEDIHGVKNDFAAYCSSIIKDLNASQKISNFQQSIHSIHFYPYCLVIEKNSNMDGSLRAEKRGTMWQPFFDSEK